jgi:hypothetical protein
MGGFDQGWALGSNLAAQHTARKQQLADEERQLKATDLLQTRNNILTKLPTLLGPNGEKTTEYDQAYQSLTQAQGALGQLYHPDKAPGALQKDWHFLLEKMHGIGAPKDNKTPSSITSQTPETTINTPAALTQSLALPASQQIVPTLSAGGKPSQAATPLTITQSFAGKSAPGMVSQGNIDLSKRPNIDNGDGTHSSVFSMSFGTDKGEVLVPGVGDGTTYPLRKLTPKEALDQYKKTGNNLGTFKDAAAANAYGKTLHNDQAKYNNQAPPNAPARVESTTVAQPGAESVTMPTMAGSVTLPAPPPVTVTKAPPVPWGQAQVLKQRAASMQKAQQEASLLASGVPLSPQQQAMSQVRTDNIIREAQIDESLKLAEKLGITGSALDEFKQQLVGIKNVTFKPLTGAAGAPSLAADGRYYQAGSDANGNVVSRPMPIGWKPNTKAVRGTLINTKSNGWVQTWVDPYNPSKVIGFQKVTPGSRYTGSISSSSSTDPFGLTTSSSRSTTPTSGSTPVDVDLSGMQELPESFNGEDIPESPNAAGQAPVATAPPSGSPNKSSAPTPKPPLSVAKSTTGGAVPQVHPKTGATPAQLKSQIPAPPQAPTPTAGTLALDSTGHIPANAPYNASLVGAANQLLDGMDIAKLTIPQKAKEAASNLARAYGWGGQGMFTPREALQLKEGASFLNMMANSPTLKVLDNGFLANIPMTGSSSDPAKEGFFGKLMTNLSAREQTPEQQKFMDLYRQLDAMAIGLRALVQTGRGTQKQTDLLISELPNPYNTPSSADAKRRLQLVQKELDIAAKTGHLPEFEDMQKDFNASPKNNSQPHQHNEGDWVMLGGRKVQIKKINRDGTFDY